MQRRDQPQRAPHKRMSRCRTHPQWKQVHSRSATNSLQWRLPHMRMMLIRSRQQMERRSWRSQQESASGRVSEGRAVAGGSPQAAALLQLHV